MPNRDRRSKSRLSEYADDLAPEAPEPTAQPRDRVDFDEERGDRVVPMSNVGGAAPTRLGNDSGGDWPGPEDDLTNLIEPEPPESPEVGAMHIRRRADPGFDE